jgi:hypothetical protein
LPVRRISRDASIAACIWLGVGPKLGVLADESFNHLPLPLDGRAVHLTLFGHVDRLGYDVGIGMVRDEGVDGIDPVRGGGKHQRRLAPFGLARIDVALGVGQQVHDLAVAGNRRQMHRRRTARIGLHFDSRTALEQRLHDARAPGLGGEMQRGVLTDSRHGGGVRASVDEQLGHLGVTALGRPMQGGHAIALRGADVSALLEQCLERVLVATHGGIGHWGRALRGSKRSREAERDNEVEADTTRHP